MIRTGYPLIPEKGKTTTSVEVAKGAPGDVTEDDFHFQAIPETDEQALASWVDHGFGCAHQGDAFASHPGAHMFPVVEVGGEEQGGPGAETIELGHILGAENDRPAIAAMEEAEKIQDGGMVEPDPETQGVSKAADPSIGAEGVLFPAYYNKGPNQGEGQG